MLGNTDIEKLKFHYHKNLILVDDGNIDKILIFHKVSCRKGYK